MKKIHIRLALALAALLLAPAVLPAAGGSSSSVPSAADMPDLTPQQKAMNAYRQGLSYRDKAWKLEEEAAGLSGDKAAKKAAKAQKAFKKAIMQYEMAIEQVPNFHQALSSLGYALRKTGRYEESLAAYDQALAIDPRYAEAIEYRGEAYLGLDRIEEAKGAYMELFQIDRERAAELMTAMKRWIEQRRSDAGDLPQETIDSFAAWVEERSSMVAQVGVLASLERSW